MQIAALGHIDLVVFGSPCQDLSVAGKQKGLSGARSGLFFPAIDIVSWCRLWCGTRFALWENVPGAFSSNKGRDFAAVVDALAGLDGTGVPPKGWGTEGCTVGTEAMVEWSTLDAQWFGVAQRRRRVFALADFGDWAGRQPILLEPQGLRGDTAPSREAGQETAGTLEASIGSSRGAGTPTSILNPVICAPVSPCLRAGGNSTGGDRPPGTDVDTCDSLIAQQRPVLAYGGNNQAGAIDVATARNACSSSSGRLDFESETFVVCVTGDATHTLTSEGFDASEDGTGRGTPIIAFDTTQCTSTANRSSSKPGDAGHPLATGAHPPAIAFPANLSGTQCASTEELAPVLGAKNPTAVAIGIRNGKADQDGPTMSLLAGGISEGRGMCINALPHTMTAMQVRRLTPTECERLQGFRDGHTAIPYRKKSDAQCPDGPRYKALGNSMAVPVMRWIGQRIDLAVLFQT